MAAPAFPSGAQVTAASLPLGCLVPLHRVPRKDPENHSFPRNLNNENKNIIFHSLTCLIILQLGLKLVTYLYCLIIFIKTYCTVPPAQSREQAVS